MKGSDHVVGQWDLCRPGGRPSLTQFCPFVTDDASATEK